MHTLTLTYAGQSIALPDLPQYAKFYRKLSAGTWEPRTFATLARNLDADTAYLDIGAWIGVTPFWATHHAARVIAVEPDPQCLSILRALAPAYGNLALLEGALSPQAEVTVHSVGGFGSSETSVLSIGDGPSGPARGWPMTTLLDRAKAGASGGKVFVKIDIEGYEYKVLSELAALRNPSVVGLQIALHPDLLERSLTGPLPLRRLRALRETWKLSRLLSARFGTPFIHKHPSVWHYLLFGVLLPRHPRGTDLVYDRRDRQVGQGRSMQMVP